MPDPKRDDSEPDHRRLTREGGSYEPPRRPDFDDSHFQPAAPREERTPEPFNVDRDRKPAKEESDAARRR